METQLIVHACKKDEIHAGVAWVPENIINTRNVVRIENKTNGKIIYIEALTADNNYISSFKSSQPDKNNYIFLNEYYRNLLGVEKNERYLFKITKKNILYSLHSSLYHPQISIKLSFVLGFISFILGLIGIALGVLSLYLGKFR